MQQQVWRVATRIQQLSVLAGLPQANRRLPARRYVFPEASRLHHDGLPDGESLLWLRVAGEMRDEKLLR
jgi:hypothetical protein